MLLLHTAYRAVHNRPWVWNQERRHVGLGAGTLQKEALNTWEAVPVTGVVPSIAVVSQWISEAGEKAGSTVTLKNVESGVHVLLLKAWDRAGNLSPHPLRINWTVDTIAPSNCSIVEVNGGAVARVSQRPVNATNFSFHLAGLPTDPGGPLAAVVYHWHATGGSRVQGVPSAPGSGGSSSGGGGSSSGGSSSGGSGRELVGAQSGIAEVFVGQLVDGTYGLSVFGQDEAGNLSPARCTYVSWTVDLTPPVRAPLCSSSPWKGGLPPLWQLPGSVVVVVVGGFGLNLRLFLW